MIDEELYQQAADELNSDRRRPHIWARACALASDDHDEARYLYTNLRVEELIAEREAGATVSDSKDISQDQEHDSTLALEPLDFDDALSLDTSDDVPESVPTPAGVDQSPNNDRFTDEDLNPFSAIGDAEPKEFPERVSFEEQFDQITDDAAGVDQIASPDMRQPRDEKLADHLAKQDVGFDDEAYQGQAEAVDTASSSDGLTDPVDSTGSKVSNDNQAQLDAILSGIYSDQRFSDQDDDEGHIDTAEIIADFEGDPESDRFRLDDADVEQELADSELAPGDELLDDDLPTDADPGADSGNRAVSLELQSDSAELAADESLRPHDLETQRLAKDLERQADQLPGQSSDIVSDIDSEPVAASTDASPGKASSHLDSTGSKTAVAAAFAASALPVDLTAGKRGTRYAIYQDVDDVKAVKTGVSWSALFLTLPFLLYRKLFGTALVYLVTAVLSLSGLLICGLVWLDNGMMASPWIQTGTLGFGLIAFLAMVYLPFRYGNRWREEKLEAKGYELVAWVKASSVNKAITAARKAATLD